jgi:hypothetical protein
MDVELDLGHGGDELVDTWTRTTAYLMLGGRCLLNCAFCAQARESQAGALNLSRVTWPEYELDAVIGRLAQAAAGGDPPRLPPGDGQRRCLYPSAGGAARSGGFAGAIRRRHPAP